jgi:hypothetical protein
VRYWFGKVLTPANSESVRKFEIRDVLDARRRDSFKSPSNESVYNSEAVLIKSTDLQRSAKS